MKPVKNIQGHISPQFKKLYFAYKNILNDLL